MWMEKRDDLAAVVNVAAQAEILRALRICTRPRTETGKTSIQNRIDRSGYHVQCQGA